MSRRAKWNGADRAAGGPPCLANLADRMEPEGACDTVKNGLRGIRACGLKCPSCAATSGSGRSPTPRRHAYRQGQNEATAAARVAARRHVVIQSTLAAQAILPLMRGS